MGAKQILVVEDNPFVGALLRNKLQVARYSVVWVKDLAESLKVLDSGEYDFFAAILDFGLPDAPFGEIIDHVVQRGIPSVVFTGSMSDEVRSTVWMKNVVDYVLKDNSHSPDYLVAAIKRLERNIHTKVLVVDDSSFFRQVIVDLLKVHCFQVLTAIDGDDALAVVAANPDIKLVITDYSMPEMDGFKLTQRLRTKYSKDEMAIIVISSEGQNLLAAKFIKYGANDFIIKQTFLTEEFYGRVNQCMDGLEDVRKIRDAAIRDYLTGLFNRRYFFDVGYKLFASAVRKSIVLSCAMIDIDNFKMINDTYGHEVGDQVLQHIARILDARMRSSDIVARVGGEEFCVLAVNVECGNVKGLFDELRQRVADMPLDLGDGQQLQLAVSIGVSVNNCVFSLEELLNAADKQLFIAKQQGRNQVVVGPVESNDAEAVADM